MSAKLRVTGDGRRDLGGSFSGSGPPTAGIAALPGGGDRYLLDL